MINTKEHLRRLNWLKEYMDLKIDHPEMKISFAVYCNERACDPHAGHWLRLFYASIQKKKADIQIQVKRKSLFESLTPAERNYQNLMNIANQNRLEGHRNMSFEERCRYVGRNSMGASSPLLGLFGIIGY